MSEITDFAAAQKAHNAEMKAGVADLNSSLDGIGGDVASLKAKIEELLNSSGGLTAEDRAALEEILADSAAVVADIGATKARAKTLDETTPPTPPTPPPGP